jgi:tetratricopeptide (TPR) repeat protein
MGLGAEVSFAIPRYQVGRMLGRGGMGVVYLAQDRESGETLALKLLHPSRVDADNIARFKREFRAAARFDHPSCLRVFDLDSSEGRWFYTMELAPGGCMRPSEWRSWTDLVPLALQVLAALDHIHAANVIHRDIKPQNILLFPPNAAGGAPVVKLADFGISQRTETEEDPVGQIIGSLAYLAPEQLEGQADMRSDLYSLGIVLHEALSGRNPLDPVVPSGQSDDLDTWLARQRLRAQRVRQVPRLDAANSRVPPRLADIVASLVAPDPDDRPAAASEVHEKLASWWSEQPEARSHALPEAPALRHAAVLATPRFTGRAHELGELRAYLRLMVEGDANVAPRVCFVSGPAGIGKSRLTAQVIEEAEGMGIRVDVGTWRAEGGGPWPLRGLFRIAALGSFGGHLTEAPGELGWLETATHTYVTRRPAEPAPGVDVATWVGAETAQAPSSSASVSPTSPQWSVYRRLVDAVLDAASEQPLLFVLEDAHWADDASVDLLVFIFRSAGQARRPRPPRLGFVVTHRSGEESAPLARLRDAAEASGLSMSVAVRPLDADGAAAMMASMLMCPCDPAVRMFAQRLFAAAGGSPLYIKQTLHLLVATAKLARGPGGWNLHASTLEGAPLPRTIDEAIGDRAARLSSDTKRTLAAAAVIGRELDLDVLEATIAMDGSLLLDCVDEGIRAGFLLEHAERAGSYRFTHDRVRESILEHLPEPERRRLHRAVALAVERVHGGAAEHEDALAHHWERAGAAPEAYRHGLAAAEFAMSHHRFAEAANRYERAEAIATRAGIAVDAAVREKRGDACLQAGRYEQALVSFNSCIETVAEPVARAALLRRCAEVEYRRGNTHGAGQQIEKVLEFLGFAVPRSGANARRWSFGLLIRFLVSSAFDRRPRTFATPREDAQMDRLLAATCFQAGEIFYFSDRYRMLGYMLSGARSGERAGRSPELALSLAGRGVMLSLAGFAKVGDRELSRARELSGVLAPSDQSWEAGIRAVSFAASGRNREYERETFRAVRLLAGSDEPMRLRQAWSLRGESLVLLGAVDAAEVYGWKTLRLAEELADHRGRGWALSLLGHAASLRGLHAEAAALYADSAASAERGADIAFALAARGSRALNLAFAGELGEALSLARASAMETARRGFHYPGAIAYAAFAIVAGLKQLRDGRLDAAARRDIWRIRLLHGKRCLSVASSAGPYLAGLGCQAMATGHLQRGRRLFAAACRLSEDRGLFGPLCRIHQVAARCFPEEERAFHHDHVRVIRGRFRELSREYEENDPPVAA